MSKKSKMKYQIQHYKWYSFHSEELGVIYISSPTGLLHHIEAKGKDLIEGYAISLLKDYHCYELEDKVHEFEMNFYEYYYDKNLNNEDWDMLYAKDFEKFLEEHFHDFIHLAPDLKIKVDFERINEIVREKCIPVLVQFALDNNNVKKDNKLFPDSLPWVSLGISESRYLRDKKNYTPPQKGYLCLGKYFRDK